MRISVATGKVVLLLLAAALTTGSCRIVRVFRSRLSLSDEQIPRRFAGQLRQPQIAYYEQEGRRMRYLTIGSPDLPPLLLLHGSPGSWTSWDDVLLDSSIYNHARVIVPDRPGYGYSDYGHSFTSVKAEALFMERFLQEVAPVGPVHLAGSSYGGSVAVQLATTLSHRLASLTLISASVQPGAEKIYGITPFIQENNLRGLVPRLLRMPNDEKIAHAQSLREITGWDSIRSPVWILHGDADKLVFYSNAIYAREKLRNANVTLVTVPGAGHDINWKRPQLVADYLRKAIAARPAR